MFLVALFPGTLLGPELAAIFAIFTSRARNMAFRFYQSLRTIPGRSRRGQPELLCIAVAAFLTPEAPFAMPGLIWNMMMTTSMSGGWFFVAPSEAISVGPLHITSQMWLPADAC